MIIYNVNKTTPQCGNILLNFTFTLLFSHLMKWIAFSIIRIFFSENHLIRAILCIYLDGSSSASCGHGKKFFLNWVHITSKLIVNVWCCLANKLNEHFCVDWQIIWFHEIVPQPLQPIVFQPCFVLTTLVSKPSATINVSGSLDGEKSFMSLNAPFKIIVNIFYVMSSKE